LAVNNILNIQTPAQKEALNLKSDHGIESLGLTNLHQVYWNLPAEALYEEIVVRGEGKISQSGAVVVNTGMQTARSPNDKYIVRESTTEEDVWWGEYNRPLSSEKFNELFIRLQGFLQGKDVFVQDCFVCADPQYQMPIRIISEYAWHSLFARNMFILPRTRDEYKRHVPDFTILSIPSFHGLPQIDGTQTGTFIAINFGQCLCIIGNTAYAGEIKKSVFTILNYQLPLRGVMPMHCSANIGGNGDTALFFGLSGTGKTTLSAVPTRRLIGDDEHGWNDNGVFNFEAGCYAKVIKLSPSAEPQIHACTRRFGTILENVVFDATSRNIDLDDDSITENTRASYPLEYIENTVMERRGAHPKSIVILTCDAFGVMPPIARLTPEQTLYQFISGYTSKIAGTEIELGREPEITFSTCLGAPFMVHRPAAYVELMKRKIMRHSPNCWLVNTGWIGGPFGVGKRISIEYTRILLEAALAGKLVSSDFHEDPIFRFQVPENCEGVPAKILNPADSWPDKASYVSKYRQLAMHFVYNFKKFETDCPELVSAGPRLNDELSICLEAPDPRPTD
jgi:phosphoenolpyruvate carboxykinase (ATP)